MIKKKYDGNKVVVEYENPMLEIGVEYRTTERFNGKAVYAKLVNFGELPNTGTKLVAYCSEGSTGLVSLTAMFSNGGVISAGYGRIGEVSTTHGLFIEGTLYNVRIRTETEFPGITATVLAKYTKE